MKIELEPFAIGETLVSEVHVKHMNFVEYAEMAAQLMGAKNAQRDYQRMRIRKTVTFLIDGKAQSPTDEQITQLPIRTSRKILDSLDSGARPGEVISPKDADGIDRPLLYRLGTPIKYVRGKDTVEIHELEFWAKIFGDIEDIISIDALVLRAVEFIRRLGKPVSPDVNLPMLPSGAVAQITIADGLKIAQDVMPNFTE